MRVIAFFRRHTSLQTIFSQPSVEFHKIKSYVGLLFRMFHKRIMESESHGCRMLEKILLIHRSRLRKSSVNNPNSEHRTIDYKAIAY